MKYSGGGQMNAGKPIFLYLLLFFFALGAYGQLPGCTMLTNPLDNDIDVPVTSIISWGAVPTATKYFVSIGTSSGGTDVLDHLQVDTDLSYTPPSGLMPNTTYYVTIIPSNNSGDAIGCSEESFITGDSGTIPGCVTLLSPLNGA